VFGSHPVIHDWTLEVAADMATTWSVFADTDRFNRAAGLGYSFEERLDADGAPAPVGSVRKLGMTHTWDELPWRFEAPRWFRLERRFHAGPVSRVVVQLRLRPSPSGTQVNYAVEIEPRSATTRPLVVADTRLTTVPQLERVLHAAARAAEGQDADYDPTPAPLGPDAQARLERGLAAMELQAVAELVDAIVWKAPLPKQDRIHPTALAPKLGLADEAVVADFLRATQAGALELRWELTCPSCRAPKRRVMTLDAAPQEVHCRTCGLRYDGTFPDAVCVSFRPHPGVRAFEVPVDCMMSPRRTPHVLLQDVLEAGDLGDLELELASGAYTLDIGDQRVPIEVSEESLAEVCTVRVGPEGCLPRALRLRPGAVRLVLRSGLDTDQDVRLQRRGRVRKRLTLGQLLSVPGAIPLLPKRALAPDLKARVEPGVALAVDELLGRPERLDEAAQVAVAHGARSLRRTDEGLVAVWDAREPAVAAAQSLLGDLRVTAAVDAGNLVVLRQGEHTIPCGAAVDQALSMARGLGAGRVALGPGLIALGPVPVAMPVELVAGGRDDVWLLRDTTARDRHVMALRASLPEEEPTLLGERYLVREVLGKGGQGAVYAVEDRVSGGGLVAKVLAPDVMAHPRLVQFFVDEARIAATLDHPAIPKVHDVGVAPGERIWMVMDRVVGETLKARVRREGPLETDEVLAILRGVLEALVAVHSAGLVHRDVKPDNIMLGPDGTVWLLDLGIARLAVDDDPAAERIVLGTPQYLSPEQIDRGTHVDGRADLYSLGLVAHFCLMGRPPYNGRDPVEVALKRLEVDPRPLPDAVPADVRELVRWMIRREPDRRPASAAGLLAHLEG